MTFAEQVWSHRSTLLKFAHKRTGNFHQAEDLVSEVMLKAITHQHQFQEGSNLRAWLTTILVNAHNMQWKREKRISFVESPPDTLVSPAMGTCRLELEEVMCKAKPELISYVCGMTHDDLAKHFDVPIGTIKSRLSRAREYLRR